MGGQNYFLTMTRFIIERCYIVLKKNWHILYIYLLYIILYMFYIMFLIFSFMKACVKIFYIKFI